MACIIRMSSDKFLDKFIKEYDYKKFNFLLISEDIKTNKKYKNVYSLPTLIPPPNVITEFVSNGFSGRYVKKFGDYLQTPRVEAMITIMVKLCLVENANVILLCSKAEKEFKYLNIICDYIENLYGIETYTFKKYKENTEKCKKVSEKVKKKAIKILEKKLGQIHDIEEPVITPKEAKERFMKLSKKELKQYMKANSIRFDPDGSKKDLVKTLVKAMKLMRETV